MDDSEVEKIDRKFKKNEAVDFEELLYAKRCQLVKLSNSSHINRFMSFLKDNEHIFKRMDDCDKECMRRTCDRILSNSYSTIDDVRYCDRLFGHYIDPRHSNRIPTMGNDREHKEKPMSLEEEIAYRSRGSYYAMWSFITNPEFQEKLKGRADLYDKVKFMIDRAKDENEAVTINLKRYEPSDEEMYVKVLGLMKDVQN